MATQLDHEEVRRHLTVARGGGMTWMSDLDPLELAEGLLDIYDDSIAEMFTQEHVDDEVEKAKEQQKEELDEEHKTEIGALTNKHADAIFELEDKHRAEIAGLTSVLHGRRPKRFNELDDSQLARLDDRELREAYAALRRHHVEETTSLLMQIGALARLDEIDPASESAPEPKPETEMDDAPPTAPLMSLPPMPAAIDQLVTFEPAIVKPDISVIVKPPRERKPRPVKAPRVRAPPESRVPRATRVITPSSIGVLPVVLAVLTEAGIGVALSVNDIVARAGDRLPTKSKTPSTIVSRDLALDIKRHGDASRFRRASAGIFRLAMAHELVASATPG